MKTKFFLLPFVGLLALACNKAEMSSPRGNEPMLITFSAEGDGINAEVSTKATAVTSLTTFNVTASKGSSTETAVFQNTAFTGSSSYTGGVFWPSTDQKYHFYASNVSMTFSSTACTVSPANAGTDVIVAYLSSPEYGASNALTFNHIFARIGEVTIKAPSGYTLAGTPTLALSAPVSGTYDIKSSSWTKKGTASAQSLTVGSASQDVWVVPGAYSLSVTYTLTKGDYSETFTKTANVNLQQGKINSITATAPAGNATGISFTVNVTAWGSNPINVNLS